MSEVAEAGARRARGAKGGGAARRSERSAVRIESARYIERAIPTVDILSTEALEIIERNAETVLEEIGAALAGKAFDGTLAAGQCVRVTTGAVHRTP